MTAKKTNIVEKPALPFNYPVDEQGNQVLSVQQAFTHPNHEDGWVFVEESDLNWLQDKINKQGKRAAKLGVKELAPVLTVGALHAITLETCNRDVARRSGGVFSGVREFDNRRGPTKVYSITRYCYPVHVKCAGVLRLNDWIFVARVEHGEAVNVFYCAADLPDTCIIPDTYRKSAPQCQHCDSKRTRKDTFICWNANTGEFKQIGRQCLADFLGHKDAVAYANFVAASWKPMWGIRVTGDDEWVDRVACMRVAKRYSTRTVLLHACWSIRVEGFISAKKAREVDEQEDRYLQTTRHHVEWMMFPPNDAKSLKEWREWREENPLLPEDEAMADETLEWMMEQENSDFAGSYLYNLWAAAANGNITSKSFGIVCSGPTAMLRAKNRLEEKEDKPASKHVGVVGQRVELGVLQVKKVIDLDGNFGITHLHIFEDKDFNVFKWFASRERLTEGKLYSVKATIKSHDEYKGVQQTMLSRCVCDEQEEQG